MRAVADPQTKHRGAAVEQVKIAFTSPGEMQEPAGQYLSL
jgi:hypothetical protein